MDQLDTNDQLTSNNTEKESSFVLQTYPNNVQKEGKLQYQLKAPLCTSHIYEELFFDHFHYNYYGELANGGLVLASVRAFTIKTDNQSLPVSPTTNDEQENQFLRAIIRTETNNYDISESININSEENILQVLFGKAQLPSIQQYQIVHDLKANDKILEFDKFTDDQHSTKIAFIFQRLNQSDEIEILSNNQMSIEMEDFLKLLSECVQLKGFNKYRGDLDIKTDQHGTYSYFTLFENHQIMFNIAPIIPSDKNDEQFIRRKSLVANSLLCIVFQEEETLFRPDFILGKVTQVYIIVQPKKIDGELYYKIETWRRCDIEPLNDPPGGIYKHEKWFRNYFLTLVLNTINIILKKDFFNSRIIEQRQRLKREYLKKLTEIFNSYSTNNPSISSNKSDDQLNLPRSNIRSRSPFDSKRFSLTKNPHLSFIPKIIGAFTTPRPKTNPSMSYISKAPLTDNESSPTQVKCNSFMFNNEQNESSSPMNNRVSYQQENFKLKESSTEGNSSLITNTDNIIQPNQEKVSSISTINNNEDDKTPPLIIINGQDIDTKANE